MLFPLNPIASSDALSSLDNAPLLTLARLLLIPDVPVLKNRPPYEPPTIISDGLGGFLDENALAGPVGWVADCIPSPPPALNLSLSSSGKALNCDLVIPSEVYVCLD